MLFKRFLAMAKPALLLFMVFSLSGCLFDKNVEEPDMELPPIANSIPGHPDIVLPSDLNLDNELSLAVNTESFKGGVYHYSGRLDLFSLKEFIKTSMANNQWKMVGEATYKQTMIAFIKPNKTCIVILYEGFGGTFGNTHVKLYVTSDLAGAKGLNPFGEPVN